jgi:predicted DsbA family dithiol-disulfide isomerase
MKVDIWSDIRCPFCYIGKRKFEMALEKFPHKDEIEVIWHSFELDPNFKTQPDKKQYEALAEAKGISLAQSKQMHEYVTQTAAEVGLEYNFDKAVVANSFNAHRLIHLAKASGKADAMKERILKAYFTEGANIDDAETLVKLGVEVGLKKEEVELMLKSDKYADDVREDEDAAQHIGIRGVPFFVLNEKYGVSGAQQPETFLKALEQAWSEREKITMMNSGDACDVDGRNC